MKADNSWTLVDFATGPLQDDYCLDEYDVDSVTYDANVYCDPDSEDGKTTKKYIILKRLDTQKYGVIELMSHAVIVPFSYRRIIFDEADKSKVLVADSDKGSYMRISLDRP